MGSRSDRFARPAWMGEAAIGGNRLVHLFRVRQLELGHDAFEIRKTLVKAKPGVALVFVADAGRETAAIVVPGIDDRIVRKPEQFVAHRAK